MSDKVEEAIDTAASKERIIEFIDSIMVNHKEVDKLQMDRYGFDAWSYSKASMLRKCPLQFYLKYVLKIKMPPDIGGRRDSLSADVGSAGHRVLELVMVGKSLEVAFAMTKKEFVPSKLTEEQWAEKVVTMEMSVIAFKERMDTFSRRNPIKRVFTEMRIGVDRNWQACAFFDNDAYYRGIIDLAIQLENNDLIILDHKTAEGFTPTSTRVYDDQLNSYKPLFHFGINPVGGSQAGIHFIRASEVKMGQYHSKEDIEGKLVRELEWSLSGNVDRVSELGFFKHECGSYCKWCDYASLCKSKEKYLKPLELDTKRVISIKTI
jgi:hypothetical protein